MPDGSTSHKERWSAANIVSLCKRLPEASLNKYLSYLREQTPHVAVMHDPEAQLFMTWDEVRTLAGAGFEIGSHTIARLERFVAGQLHWQISGLPRSWFFQMNISDAVRTAITVARIVGFRPYFEVHIPNRGGAPFLVEKEYRRCYLRMASSMELQPDIKAIFGSSWLHAEETMAISPHLAWLNRLFLDNGGILVHLGPARSDSGFLVGSDRRRELYESGAYRPRIATFLWPRKNFLKWARQAATAS